MVINVSAAYKKCTKEITMFCGTGQLSHRMFYRRQVANYCWTGLFYILSVKRLLPKYCSDITWAPWRVNNLLVSNKEHIAPHHWSCGREIHQWYMYVDSAHKRAWKALPCCDVIMFEQRDNLSIQINICSIDGSSAPVCSWSVLGPALLIYSHVKIHVIQQRLSNRASDWLAAQPPANQKPCYKIHVN